MEKEEFLRTLGTALSGEVPQHIIQENLRYYDNFISGELAKGRKEEEIMEELGGPRLIARTIIDAAEAGGEGAEGNPSGGHSEYQSTEERSERGFYSRNGYSRDGYSQDGYGQDETDPFDSQRNQGGFHIYQLNTWYWKLAGILILTVIIILLFTIIGGIASILLSPVGLVLILLLLLWRGQQR